MNRLVRGVAVCVGALAAALGTGRALAQPCAPTWAEGLAASELSAAGHCLLSHDDGSGPALYAGGQFTSAGGRACNRVAKWTGRAWEPLGVGLNAGVNALAVHRPGATAYLYAGGSFTASGAGTPMALVARWDGSGWFPAGTGLGGGSGTFVASLIVFDNGSGPALYAAGRFAIGGGPVGSKVARLAGSTWVQVGADFGNWVYTLAVYDDGAGPALHAGGEFQNAGYPGVAKWNGSAWVGVGGGMTSGAGVYSLTNMTVGGVNRLCAGGMFGAMGGVPCTNIAAWDGASWAPLGAGVGLSMNTVSVVREADDGGGPAMYASGQFLSAGGTPARNIAKWDGSSWSALTSGIGTTMPSLGNSVQAIASWNDGSGPAVVMTGDFGEAGGIEAWRITSWRNNGWSPLGGGVFGPVRAMAVATLGGVEDLYVGGDFRSVGGVAARGIARWNSGEWAPLGAGISRSQGQMAVMAVAVSDVGGPDALYAGGYFDVAGGIPAQGVARWDGSSWSALGDGVAGGPGGSTYSPAVYALATFDDGSGPALYAGGAFSSAGGVPASNIARWDGAAWSPLGSGTNGAVWALVVHDDGSGPALYAGGQFSSAGGLAAAKVARWNGSAWSALSPGLGGTSSGVYALASWNDGTGSALYAGGNFLFTLSANIVRWNGVAWSGVGGGVGSPTSSELLPARGGGIFALLPFDDGSGEALYAAGNFRTFGTSFPLPTVSRLLKWNGANWSDPGGLGVGNTADGLAMAGFDDGSGRSLFVGGAFAAAGPVSSGRIAKLRGCPVCYANCDGSTAAPVLNVNDFICFQNRYAGGDPRANCDGSTVPPVLNVNDFVCFQTKFAAGCP